MLGVGLALVAGLVAFFVVRTMLGGGETTLEEFAAGKGIMFSEPSGRFSVRLPSDPETRSQSVPLPDGSQLETVIYYVDREPDYVFLAALTVAGSRPVDLDAA
ncbi:MAG: hypothetical protein WD826_05160, partial [Actinomycetota bacterium]